MNEHITDLFSDKATIIGRFQGVERNQTYNFNKGDMIAEGNVEIISILITKTAKKNCYIFVCSFFTFKQRFEFLIF